MSEALTGRVLKGIGGFYYVLADDGREYTLRAQSKIRREHLKPMVGDRVEFEPGTEDENGWMVRILPRRNSLLRPPVANIDTVVLTLSASVPKADLMLIDRLMIYARMRGIEIKLAVNKADMDPDYARQIAGQYIGSGAECFAVSAVDGMGLEALRCALRGKVHAFAGQSGVGKSSLINALYGIRMEVGDISRKIERGKHTTRSSCLVAVEGGGAVLDTPGFSLFESELMEPVRLQEMYPEFDPYRDKCRFSPCRHKSEPDCAVKQAVLLGRIDPGRHERYTALLDEMSERWQNRYD